MSKARERPCHFALAPATIAALTASTGPVNRITETANKVGSDIAPTLQMPCSTRLVGTTLFQN